MKAENEVAVDPIELRSAAKWLGRGKAAAAAHTLLYRSEEGFVVETAMARTVVKSAGRWSQCVAVHAGMFKRLCEKLKAGPDVTLLYVDGFPMIGPTRITARTVALPH